MFDSTICWICQKAGEVTTLQFDVSNNVTMFMRHCNKPMCVKAAQKRARVTA